MRKFTEVQLSRILSEHAVGHLIRCGESWSKDSKYIRFSYERAHNCCINQAAYVEGGAYRAGRMNKNASWWFDHNYCSKWFPEVFLMELKRQGLA